MTISDTVSYIDTGTSAHWKDTRSLREYAKIHKNLPICSICASSISSQVMLNPYLLGSAQLYKKHPTHSMQNNSDGWEKSLFLLFSATAHAWNRIPSPLETEKQCLYDLHTPLHHFLSSFALHHFNISRGILMPTPTFPLTYVFIYFLCMLLSLFVLPCFFEACFFGVCFFGVCFCTCFAAALRFRLRTSNNTPPNGGTSTVMLCAIWL